MWFIYEVQIIGQSCLDPGVTLFKHCMGKYLANCLGIYIQMVLMNRLNLKCYVYHKNRILSVSEMKLEFPNL